MKKILVSIDKNAKRKQQSRIEQIVIKQSLPERVKIRSETILRNPEERSWFDAEEHHFVGEERLVVGEGSRFVGEDR